MVADMMMDLNLLVTVMILKLYKKNIATAGKQPASLKEAGMDSDKAGQTKELPNVSNMTYEEFSALPASTKSKMRGDML